jgi:hypothetical protein
MDKILIKYKNLLDTKKTFFERSSFQLFNKSQLDTIYFTLNPNDAINFFSWLGSGFFLFAVAAVNGLLTGGADFT